MSVTAKILVSLILLGIIDVIIPIPIVSVILIYVILQKPPWFREIVRAIYDDGRENM